MQFFFAADRGNPRTGQRYDFLSLPSLHLLAHVRELCAKHDVPVSICGELGGRPLEAMALLALGYTRFSLPSAAIGPVKRMVRSAHFERLHKDIFDLLDAAPDDMRAAVQAMAEKRSIKL